MVLQATQTSIQPTPDGSSGIPVTLVTPPGESGNKTEIVGQNLDAFGRLRTSENLTLWDYVSKYELDTFYTDTITATGGAVAYDSNTNHINLSCAAGSGSRAVLQSKGYLRYQPGKSGLCKMTCNFKESSPTEVAVVQRSKTTGSVVDTRKVRGTDWIDDLDGTGNSEVTIDFNKGNLFFIDFAYLGVGPVRFYVISPAGKLINAYIFENPSANDEMYMQTATLPFRVEVHNDGSNTYKRIGYFDDDNGLFWEIKSASGSGDMNFFCAAIESEAGNLIEQERGKVRSVGIGTTGKSVAATEIPLISIRPKTTYQSKTNRGAVIAAAIDLLSTAKDVRLRVTLNADITGGTAPSWTSVGDDSITEYDTTADAISFTGATILREMYVNDAGGQINLATDALEEIKLTLDAAGTTADVLTISAIRLNTTATMYASISFKELQ